MMTSDERHGRMDAARVRAELSVPLLAVGESIGAMKVYSVRPANYGPHEERVMRLLAGQAAILLANSQSLSEARRLSRQLTEALGRRDAIAQAVGVLLARGASSHQEAFGHLAAAAQRSHRSIEDVARALVAALTAGDTHAADA